MTVLLIAAPLWLTCALLVWRERSLYARQSRLARGMERMLFGRSSPILTRVQSDVNRHLCLGRRALESGQVRVASPSVGPICSDSSASRPVPPSPGALHLVSQTNAALKVDEIVVVAIPERSWSPVKVTAKVTTSLVIEEAS